MNVGHHEIGGVEDEEEQGRAPAERPGYEQKRDNNQRRVQGEH